MWCKIHQLISALYTYAQTNGGTLPPSLTTLQPPSSQTSSRQFSKLLVCEASGAPHVYVGSGINIKTAPAGTVLIYEQPGGHRDGKRIGISIGYVDGSVRLSESPQAEKIIAELKAGHNPPRPEKIK